MLNQDFTNLRCALGFLLLSFGAGCLDSEGAESTEETSFIAVQQDFADFATWDSFEIELDGAEGTRAHSGDGPLMGYINQLPPAESTEFPVGTILVKTVEAGAPQDWTIQVMVKRGGNFNALGALGWEYLDLEINAENTPVILWRGEAPPSGHGYEALGGTETEIELDCNSCHAVHPEKDYVLSDELSLQELAQ